MINSSKQIVSLSISEKLGTVQRYKVCETETINTLVTELDPNNPQLETFKTLGIEVL